VGVTIVAALVTGGLIGLSLGALGSGGSVLAVPVLVFGFEQSPAQATTGSLVVVGLASLTSAITAARGGTVLLGRGLAFGVAGLAGAAAGANASTRVPEPVLLTAFAVLMLLVGIMMLVRLARGSRAGAPDRSMPDDPIVMLSPAFACRCPAALKLLTAATTAGLLTGFLGVGGGFLVVPALALVMAMPMRYAVGTSLVVIAVTSSAALAVRVGARAEPDWVLTLALSVTAVAAGHLGVRLATRIDGSRLAAAFTVLVLTLATYTAIRAVPAVV
jgi:uncharacterized membrane protein YfcA